MKDILIIDDEQDVLDIVRAVLNTKGYHIREALGGAEGIRKLEQKAPDLIICDLMMPRVSGRDVIKAAKGNEKYQEIPFITVSAVGADQNKPATFWAQGLGVDEYLFKPFDPMDLLGKVEALLRRSGYGPGKAKATPLPVSSGKQSAPQVAPAVPEIKLPPTDAPPSGIAKIYLLCWNDQNWRLEYNLMAPEMTQAYSLEVYKEARDNSYREALHQKVELISEPSESINNNMATVIFDRKDMTKDGRAHLRRSTVSLRKSEKGWRVIRVKDETL